MTAKEIQKRNAKTDQLKVLHTDDEQFFVESEKGKILYNVILSDDGDSCTCADFASSIKKDPRHKCKHILAVYNAVARNVVTNAYFLEKPIPQLDERFIANIKGKDFVLYAGILDYATQKGLMKLEVELLQYPTKENNHEAVCRAIAESKNGELFADIGDANPSNTATMISKHIIRMASTRAKARALRDLCNIGMTALEEISDFDDVIESKSNGNVHKAAPRPRAIRKPAPPQQEQINPPAENTQEAAQTTPSPAASSQQAPSNGNANGNGESAKSDPAGPKLSEAQRRAIYNLSRRRGISVEEMEKTALETYGVELGHLSSKDAANYIRYLQQAA